MPELGNLFLRILVCFFVEQEFHEAVIYRYELLFVVNGAEQLFAVFLFDPEDDIAVIRVCLLYTSRCV